MTNTTSDWEKFRLLFWKNWILQWNHKVALFLELFLPVIFAVTLVLVRTLVEPQNEGVQTFNEIKINDLKLMGRQSVRQPLFLKRLLSKRAPLWELAYAPKSDRLDDIVKLAVQPWGNMTYSAHENSQQLELYLRQNNRSTGVDFNKKYSGDKEFPKDLDFALRFPSELRNSPLTFVQNWATNRLFPIFSTTGPRNPSDNDGGLPPGYIREDFIAIQHAIVSSFIKLVSKKDLPEVVMKRYPYPAYVADPLLEPLEQLVPIIILLSFMYPTIFTIKSITMEKEKQIKEVMKIMGLKNWIHWAAWFTKGFLMMGFSAICIAILLKIPWSNDVSILTYSSWTVLFVFMLVYTAVTMLLCFMISSFFSRANTAAAVSGVLFFVLYLPYMITDASYDEMSLGAKMGLSLISNTGMAYGMKLILQFEGKGEGLQWSNLFSPISIDDDLSVGYVMIMMLAGSFIYLMVCLYMEQISPGDFGLPRKWYFPFTASYWCGEPDYNRITDGNRDRKVSLGNFEADPVGKKVGIQINNLRKVFPKDKVAVNDVSMNMYEDEITVLLGHNGAGKTTTISMLTGMFPPTSGTAIINGNDIRTHITGARQSMGFCPQHNVLFDDLTVRQHIIFFSRLKGVKGKDIDNEVERYVKILQLENKMNVVSSKLSGGMKRKLSVGTALCGGTKVVLCDEPSSGMDPAARRQLWDLLQAEKVGRTILLTTHFMDEADVLGDRIAIMCDSELKCYGSSFFLKKKFGSGYILICVKKPNCKSEDITELLQKFIPSIQIESEIGAEVTYNLPDEFSSKFEAMFLDLENSSDELLLNGYGISISSLEEVFMKVGAEKNSKQNNEDEMPVIRPDLVTDAESADSDNVFSSDKTRLLKGSNLTVNQWKAMFIKKWLYTLRHPIIFLIQIALPIYFVSVTIYVARTQSGFRELGPLSITLDSYGESTTLLESLNLTDFSNEKNISLQYESYAKNFNTEFKAVGDMEDSILKLYQTFKTRINNKYVAAATVSMGKITAWLNNQPLHTAPLTLNMVHNAIARVYIGPECKISVTNMPLPFSPTTKLSQILMGNSLGSQMASNICFCMSFITSFIIFFIIKERVSRAKLLQFVGGVRVWTFWITQLIWDYFTYFVIALILILTVSIYQEKGYATFSELGQNFLILIIFGLAAVPYTYIWSDAFNESSTGFGRLSAINVFTGMVLYLVIVIMKNPTFDTENVANVLEWFFMVFPHYSLASSISKLSSNIAIRNVCDELCHIMPINCTADLLCQLGKSEEFAEFGHKECCLKDLFGWESPGILPELLYMSAGFFVFFAFVIMKEYKLFRNFTCSLKKKSTTPASDDAAYFDDDVDNERKRIKAMSPDTILSTNLVLDEISKDYGNYLAVNKLSLGVNHSECFGLLGVNGAGKTTTFKMMTGDERITSGEAYIKGINLKSDMTEAYQEIGYCPQFDALFDDLTGRETLRIFCLLRGIKKYRIKFITEELARAFGFTKHLDKQTKTYSGGNKRKLSTSLALIGSPSVIYLDEPTSGMDPAARRNLWNVICKIRDMGDKSIVLTSHSMEECEALCTRLAIMVNGEFKCLGSTQHLKNKFSKGLILRIKLKKEIETSSSFETTVEQDDAGRLTEFITNEFPEAVLQESYQGILTYYIPSLTVRWSQMFGLMEANKQNLNIEDYSISQTTLEQIFLDFAKYQREDPREIK